MKHCVILTLVIAAMPICDPGAAAELSTITTLIQPEPLHAGRIDPKLFGNFIELLDDVVPGMWADMLNDRSSTLSLLETRRSAKPRKPAMPPENSTPRPSSLLKTRSMAKR